MLIKTLRKKAILTHIEKPLESLTLKTGKLFIARILWNLKTSEVLQNLCGNTLNEIRNIRTKLTLFRDISNFFQQKKFLRRVETKETFFHQKRVNKSLEGSLDLVLQWPIVVLNRYKTGQSRDSRPSWWKKSLQPARQRWPPTAVTPRLSSGERVVMMSRSQQPNKLRQQKAVENIFKRCLSNVLPLRNSLSLSLSLTALVYSKSRKESSSQQNRGKWVCVSVYGYGWERIDREKCM